MARLKSPCQIWAVLGIVFNITFDVVQNLTKSIVLLKFDFKFRSKKLRPKLKVKISISKT